MNITQLHEIMMAAGRQVPTAIAAPLTVASLPTAIDAAFNVAASIATGNYVGAAMTGAPLLISTVIAGYGVFAQPKEPTNAQITDNIHTLTREQLIELCRRDTSRTGGNTNATGVPIATRDIYR